MRTERNAIKHGIDFQTAAFAFDDPYALVLDDARHSTHELRQWLIGDSGLGVLIVVFTMRSAKRGKCMSRVREFDFSRARRVTPEETRKFRKAIEATFHVKRPRRGRPPKGRDKYREISIRLHPKALEWARMQAKRRGIGYQTVINDTLLHHAA